MPDNPQDQRIELFDRSHIEGFPRFFRDGDDRRLFEAIKNQELIVFYGAGVSKLAGCAGWYELACNVIQCFGSSVYSDLYKAVLRETAAVDARKAISICAARAKADPELEAAYYQAIRDSVKPQNEAAFIDIHEQLCGLRPAAFITTNIDKGIERVPAEVFGARKVINLTTLDVDPIPDLRNGNIFYLHGSTDAIDKTVLTTDQYIEYYYNRPKPDLKNFLREVFIGKYSVLFLGYGLAEYEILQNIYLAANGHDSAPRENRHFLLTPIFSRDVAKFNVETEYFRLFSVRAIPYFIDHEGYGRLNYVLRELRKEIQASAATLDLMREIDSV